MLTIELWEPIYIDGIRTDYHISDMGRVKRPDGTISLGHGPRYKYVSVTKNGRQWHPAVYRLVAETFIPNPENKPEVNHLDGRKDNNRADNLEWATPKENIQHALKYGLLPVGENAAASKLKNEQVHEICKLLQDGVKRKKIAKKLGIPISVVHDIYYGNTWKHIAKDYDFQRFHSRSADVRQAILANGQLSNKEIIKMLGWEDTKDNRQLVATTRHSITHPYIGKRKSKVLCSTTIPSVAKTPMIEETFQFLWEK